MGSSLPALSLFLICMKVNVDQVCPSAGNRRPRRVRVSALPTASLYPIVSPFAVFSQVLEMQRRLDGWTVGLCQFLKCRRYGRSSQRVIRRETRGPAAAPAGSLGGLVCSNFNLVDENVFCGTSPWWNGSRPRLLIWRAVKRIPPTPPPPTSEEAATKLKICA